MSGSAPQQAELLEPDPPPPADPRLVRLRGKQDPEELFGAQCRSYRLPRFEVQFKFAQSITFVGTDGRTRRRQWRFDFAFPELMVAVEIEGLIVRRVWSAELEGGGPVVVGGYVRNVKACSAITVAMGGHATITGFREDALKYNSAALLGWFVIRFLQNDVKPGHAIEMTQRVLAARGWKGPPA